jgi:glucose/arabinose dehydrogenase
MNPRWPVVVCWYAALQCAAQVPVATVRLTSPEQATRLVYIAQPPGESRRLYIVGQTGYIYVLRDGNLLPTPFLDIHTQIYVGAEAGLLGLAFHRQFATNGYFFVYYMSLTSPSGVHVVRYQTDPANPETADPTSAQPVLFIPRGAGYHFAGWMGFGPDGYLYIASGNAFTDANSSSLTTLLGKLLRIDVDHDDFPNDPLANYAVPPTNPLFGSTAGLPEIWAYGLRNPWRCSFDRATGDLWPSDVGGAHAGEVNFQPAGLSALRNYGWPCMDGNQCLASTPGCTCNSPSLTMPIYDMASLGAMIGGYVYRGSAIPSLRGTYFFADYQNSYWSFRYDGTAMTELTNRTAEFAIPIPTSTTSFGEDNTGELYVVTSAHGVFKIVPPCPANCDDSNIEPRLNINDFQCFLNKFAAGDSYANCDGSTTPPVLTAADFTCFLNLYTAGCP